MKTAAQIRAAAKTQNIDMEKMELIEKNIERWAALGKTEAWGTGHLTEEEIAYLKKHGFNARNDNDRNELVNCVSWDK